MKCYVKPYEGNEDFLFFSYCHDDAAVVYPIIERLSLEGFRVWYDDGIHPGDDWPEVIAEHLTRAKVCVAAISPKSAESHNCKNELSYAVGNNKPFLSVILYDFRMTPGMKLQLSSSRFLRKFDLPEDGFYAELTASPVLSACRDAGIRATADTLARWREHVLEYQDAQRKGNEAASGADSAGASASARGWISAGWQPKESEEEAAARRRAEEEAAARRRAEEEAAARRRAEEEARRQAEAEEARRQAEAEEAKRKAEEEAAARRKAEEEAKRKAEEEAARRRAEEEARRQAEAEEAKRRAEEEAAARRKAEEEAAAARRRAEEAADESTVFIGDDEGDSTVFIDEDEVTTGYEAPALLVRVSTGEFFPLKKRVTTLGRPSKSNEDGADLTFAGNRAISRKHAELIREGDRLSLHELNATFGTEVDGKAVAHGETVPLPECAELKLADERFFVLSGNGLDSDAALTEQKLCLLRSEDTGEMRQLTGREFPLDRNHPWQEGVLSSDHISRAQHAMILQENGRSRLLDLGTASGRPTNGTFHNGRRLNTGESAELHSGDTVTVYQSKFTYYEARLGAQS